MICVDRKKSLHVGKNFKKVGGHLLYLSGKNLRVSTHLASNVVWHLLVLKDDAYTKPEGERDLSSVTPLGFLEKALLDFCRKSPRYSSLSSIKRSRQRNVYSTVKRKVHKNPGLLSWILSSSTLFWLFCCPQLLQWRRHKKFCSIIHRYNSLFSRGINPTLEKFPSIVLNTVQHTLNCCCFLFP